MENLKVKLYNAILTIFDESLTEYNGLDDEEFMEKVCQSVGMTEPEYKELMFEKNLTEEGYDFEEICPHCDYVNKVVLSETREYKNGKRTLVCKDCGKTILACNLCDCVDCGNCCVEEGNQLKQYAVKITEKLEKVVYIEAESGWEAEAITEANWDKGEYILDADCFTIATFEAEENNQ